ncbi:uncharacterized protein [Diadema antillarum]|uniref:uncharacterized protein n=1 Tax=Diadema antillarum TaxID=105358 RepID=UPI003A8B07B9
MSMASLLKFFLLYFTLPSIIGKDVFLQDCPSQVEITRSTFSTGKPVLLIAPGNRRVLVHFENVELGSGEYLELYHQDTSYTPSTPVRLMTVRGRLMPPPLDLVSPGQKLKIYLNKRRDLAGKHSFSLMTCATEGDEYNIMVPPGDSHTNVSSPNYPSHYLKFSFAFYVIEAPLGCRVRFEFTVIDVGEGDTVCVTERHIVAFDRQQCLLEPERGAGANATSSGPKAYLWFDSRGLGSFSLKITSVSANDDSPCTSTRYSSYSMPSFPISEGKHPRHPREDGATFATTPEAATGNQQTLSAQDLMKVVGVLWAMVITGVLLNQLCRRMTDSCCPPNRRETQLLPNDWFLSWPCCRRRLHCPRCATKRGKAQEGEPTDAEERMGAEDRRRYESSDDLTVAAAAERPGSNCRGESCSAVDVEHETDYMSMQV